MSCKEAMAALVQVIEQGGAIAGEEREHIRNCARCRELLDSAEEFQASIEREPLREPAMDEQRITHELRALRMREPLRRAAIAAGIAIAVTGVFSIFLWRADEVDLPDVPVILLAVTVGATLPVLFFYSILAALRDRDGNRICKRLKPGRQLSGVCLGLSEATGLNVIVFRLAFVALLFVKGLGLWLYIALDLAMPVHPDDRQHLLRFKLRRAWQRRLAHEDNDAR